MISRPHLTLPLLAPLLLACPDGGEDGGEGDEQGDTGDTGSDIETACFDPGSELLPGARQLLRPSAFEAAGLRCTEGWASDAPGRAAQWTIDIGTIEESDRPQLRTHPDGGVVLAVDNSVRRFSADGELLWTYQHPVTITDFSLLVGADGSVLVSAWDWDSYVLVLLRLDAAGVPGSFELPLISEYASVWAMESLGEDLILGVDDMTLDGWEQPTLLRVSAAGEELLRKSNPSVFGRPFAVNQSGTVLFGNPLVSAANGAVLGSLSISQGGAVDAVGVGDEFFLAGNDADLLVARHSPFGAERWIRIYDRYGDTEQARALDASPDGGAVIVGIERFVGNSPDWYSWQPLVLAVDADGNALWRDRIASPGEAVAVAVAADGSVYVAGQAEAEPEGPGQVASRFNWLRKY